MTKIRGAVIRTYFVWMVEEYSGESRGGGASLFLRHREKIQKKKARLA
jgi:hypothetical protein